MAHDHDNIKKTASAAVTLSRCMLWAGTGIL